MRVFQQKRKLRRAIYSFPVLALLFVIALFSINGTWQVYNKQIASTTGLTESQIEWSRLKQRESELEADIEKLKSQRGFEAEIREKFSVGKEGEKVAVIVNTAAVGEGDSHSGIWAFWQGLWEGMFGRR